MKKKAKPSETLVPVFVPPLIALLQQRERVKGAALTKAEVLEIRDNATMIMVKSSEATKMAQTRGYSDIDPDKAYEQWLEIRKKL